MTVIILILKIIGILLLSLLGIVLLGLMLVLFVPIRYQISGEIDQTVDFLGRLHWLLHMVSISFCYENGVFDYTIRLFGFRLQPGKRKKQLSDENGEEISLSEEEDEMVKEESETSAKISEKIEPLKPSKKESTQKETPPKELQKKKRSILQKICDKITHIKKAIEQFLHTLKQLPQKITDIKMLLTDETNKKSVSLIWAELKSLLHHSRFRRIRTNLNFSMGDPALTGQLLGVLCMIPVLYQYEVKICPDFEAEAMYVKGNYFLKGHIRFVHILVSAVRLWKEKEFRKFVNHISKK